MKLFIRLMLAAGLLALTLPAVAFQEERSGGGTAGAGAVPGSPAPKTTFDAATGQAKPQLESGTTIRIPGLGKLGVIPKLDFGLELLYGAGKDPGEAGTTAPEIKPESEDGDLRIRGSVKHRF